MICMSAAYERLTGGAAHGIGGMFLAGILFPLWAIADIPAILYTAPGNIAITATGLFNVLVR